MKYTMVRVAVAAAVCCVASLASSSAFAGWGGSYGSYGSAYGGSSGGSSGYVASYGSSGSYAGYGSSGSYVSSYGSSGGVAYGSSGVAHGPGPLRRFAAHVHDSIHSHFHRRAYYGSSGSYASYGSSGGTAYYSGYGSSGHSTYYGSSGSSVSYGSSGGSSGGSVSYGSSGVSYGSTYLGANTANNTAAALVSNTSVVDDAVYLNVAVPAAAKIYVNGAPTTSTGTTRQFVSRGLVPGKSYKFEVRAELVDAAGKLVQETKTVMATAGQRDDIEFTMASTNAALNTVVTLHVPDNAEVTLAGNKTTASGATRTFRTSQLKAGDRWDDYVVEVRVGDQVKRESLRLLAGDDVQLTFNFEDKADLVASR